MTDCTKKYSCIDCGIKQDSPANHHTVDGADLCYICSKDNYDECADCGELVGHADCEHTYNNDTICEKCCKADYTECADCDELLHNDNDADYTDEASRPVCGGCAEEYMYDEVDECTIRMEDSISATHYNYRGGRSETITHVDNVTCINDEYYTEAARDEFFSMCGGCSAYVDCEEAYYTDDSAYCEGCYPGDGSGNEGVCHKRAGSEVIGRTFTDCVSRRRYGIEIECEESADASNSNDTVFGSKEDGSLGRTGCEFYSPILCGDEGLQQLRQLCRILDYDGAAITGDCGLHIHIDLTDFNKLELSRLFYLLRAVERITRKYVSSGRSRNTYCSSSLAGKEFFRLLPGSQ